MTQHSLHYFLKIIQDKQKLKRLKIFPAMIVLVTWMNVYIWSKSTALRNKFMIFALMEVLMGWCRGDDKRYYPSSPMCVDWGCFNLRILTRAVGLSSTILNWKLRVTYFSFCFFTVVFFYDKVCLQSIFLHIQWLASHSFSFTYYGINLMDFIFIFMW